VPLELPPPSLDDVALHLAKRTSSRQADETLAIAGLFGLDASEYVPLDADQRMAKFLSEYNGGQVPYDILFLDGPKLPVESYTWAPRSFMKRQMNLELKGTYEGAMSVVTQDGLLGRYFCLILKDEWSGEGPPKGYRLKVNENEYLVVLFSRSVDEEEGEEVQGYTVLVLPRPVEKGEELLVAGARLLGSMVVGEDGDNVLMLELECYVHVFNEDRNERWNGLAVGNSAEEATRFVLIS
jgi:hypothetical protein